jgi:hypothetical protein
MITAHSDIIDFESRISNSTWDYIESLLDTSVLDHEQRAAFLIRVRDYDEELLDLEMWYLRDNQLDPITQRGNHSATEIKEHLKKLR